MQTIRGHYDGHAITLIDQAPNTAESYVLVTFLEGSLETAAARAERREVSVATYTLDRYSAALKERMGNAPTNAPTSKRPYTVGEIMTRKLITVMPMASASAAIRKMRQHGITSILVEPDESGEWGIMTMRDVLKQIVSADRAPEDLVVNDLTTRPLIYVAADMSLRDCSKLLLDTNIRRAVVREAGQPIGIISDTDIFQVVEELGWGPQPSRGEEDHT
jgi:isocitrate dehydrogenase